MDITLDNINSVLGNPSPAKLTQVFSKLLDPAQDHIFVLKYMDSIAARLETRAATETHGTGLDVFGKACVSAGIVKTTSELVKLRPSSTSYPKEIYVAQYKALASLDHLFVAGNVVERDALIDQFLLHDVYSVLMQTLSHHHLYTLRYVSAEIFISTVSSSAMLPKKVTTAVTAGIIVGLFQLALMGPEKLTEQLNSPALDWIQELPWKLNMPIPKNSDDVARYLAHFQECIIFGACWFLQTQPPRTCKDRLEILKSKPEIIDVLFDCAIIPRSSAFPTSLVCSVACEALILLFQWSSHIVPGVSTPIDATVKVQHWKALSQCLTILTSRGNWAEKILDIWMKVEEEDYLEIETMLKQDPKGNSGMTSVDEAAVLVAKNRGLIRIAILRLISTLTHAAESCGVTNAEIESLLRIAYTASRRIHRKEECLTSVEYLLHVERSVGSGLPEPTLQGPNGPKALFKVGSESVLGPIALTRLLTVLAQRKALDTIQGLKKPPNGLSSCTSLHHVQQITHPAVIHRFLTIALQRVMACTAEGRRRFTQCRYGLAQVSFICSAELAAALVAFDARTEGRYRSQVGARKELVIALSNASATALKQKEYLEVQSFGLGAISAAEDIPLSEGLDSNVVDRCRQRVREAQKFARI
ncbi:hypothetical protein V8B97DRAFT_1923525 [Scleroderma yunnanense]